MRVTFKTLSAAVVGIAMAALIAPTRAHAAIIIEFDDVDVHGGTVSQATGNPHITGTNILFDIVTLQDDVTHTTLAAAQCGLVANPANVCVLNFSFTQTVYGQPAGAGTISMKAQAGLYDAGPDHAPFTGDTGAQFLPGPPSADVFSGSIDTAGFIGNPATSTLFGISEGSVQLVPDVLAFFQVLIGGDLDLNNTEIRVKGKTSVADADVTLSGDVQLIPEPGLLSLFGLGLLAAGRRFRRQ